MTMRGRRKGKKGERVGKRDAEEKKKRGRLDRYVCTGWDDGNGEGGS